jgi:excisionase family DNA binding protein
MEDTLSTSEAARVIGVHTTTVYRYCKSGLLKSERRGVRNDFRIRPEDLEEFARKHNLPYRPNQD